MASDPPAQASRLSERIHGTVRASTVSGLGAAFRRIRRKANLPKDLVVYLARHEHATRVCEKFGVQAAADSLGHADVKTTSNRYVKKNRRLQRDRQEGLFEDESRDEGSESRDWNAA